MPRVPLSNLPIDEVLPQVVAALREHGRLVLCAPPGAGKTTRVPPALLDAGLATDGVILVLQPRRVAARATAARMSAERGTQLGDDIGYRVRFESRVSKATRIEVITEGILLRRLLSDPFLEGVAVVVFDEFHERSLASDLALGMVTQVREVRPELKIIVMSATLAAEPVAAYLQDAPIVRSEGRLFPVKYQYWPDIDRRRIEDIVADAVPPLVASHPGDCLVFLPGVGEIRATSAKLESWATANNVALEELYGDLPPQKQDAVLQPQDRRKVILSTNVAETSLTIEGITMVVDSGLARVLRYDEASGLDRLELEPISKASANQRAGRAGRMSAGLCLRLWPEAMQRHRPDFDTPEIRRVDLAGSLLQLLCWIEPDVSRFPWFETPTERALQQAKDLLLQLEAVAADGKSITELGRTLATFPIHPRLGRMLIEGAERGVVRQAALAAALLSERDPFPRPDRRFSNTKATTTSNSDLLDRVHALEDFAERGSLHSTLGSLQRNAAQQILRSSEQLEQLVRQVQATKRLENDPNDENFLRCVAVAYPDRLAKRREPNSPRGILVGGRGVRLAEESAVHSAELFACIVVDGTQSEAIVRQASEVRREWLPESLVRNVTAVFYDETNDRIIARRQTWLASLLLDEQTAPLPDDDEPTHILVQAAQKNLNRVLPEEGSAAAQFIARARCLRDWRPELELPTLDDAALAELLPQLCTRRRSLAEVRAADWLSALKCLFPYPQLRAIETEAPERIEVPSGSLITIQYQVGQPAVLAVRIQELFGLTATPRIAAGRVPLLLHLLAPNYRPEQITTDLASFWANGYPQVRKDLRGRYPKHSWPDDPLTAEPQRRPSRRK